MMVRTLRNWLLAAMVLMTVACTLSPVAKDSAAPSDRFANVTGVMRNLVQEQEISGAVMLLTTPDKVLHLSAVGQADVSAGAPMATDTIFWIASMTKPITASAILMLQDEGKLSVDDPVGKYIPELANLKTADGKPAALTLRHLLTHTSGMAEPATKPALDAHTLADLVPLHAAKPVAFTPGSKWRYCQSGINTLGRIVEVVSGQSFPDFLEQRFFKPLGMKDTMFYLTAQQRPRLAKTYKRIDGKLVETPIMPLFDPDRAGRCPFANGGLYSTAPDYVRFCQMILNEGTLDGRRYLKPESVRLMTSPQTGDLKAGFTKGCAWGLGWGIVREPQDITAMLSAGTFGHSGVYGTQAWIDPAKRVIYISMVQRADFKNFEESTVRRIFQQAAAAALQSN